jgi:hypothetical protein
MRKASKMPDVCLGGVRIPDRGLRPFCKGFAMGQRGCFEAGLTLFFAQEGVLL